MKPVLTPQQANDLDRATQAAGTSADLRLRRRRRDLRAGVFGAGRLSASAVAISWIGPSSSRARSRVWFARGV